MSCAAHPQVVGTLQSASPWHTLGVLLVLLQTKEKTTAILTREQGVKTASSTVFTLRQRPDASEARETLLKNVAPWRDSNLGPRNFNFFYPDVPAKRVSPFFLYPDVPAKAIRRNLNPKRERTSFNPFFFTMHLPQQIRGLYLVQSR